MPVNCSLARRDSSTEISIINFSVQFTGQLNLNIAVLEHQVNDNRLILEHKLSSQGSRIRTLMFVAVYKQLSQHLKENNWNSSIKPAFR